MSSEAIYTLAQVQKKFPEAEEGDAAWGPSFFVWCPFGHKKGKVRANIKKAGGIFMCHDCGKMVTLFQEWGIDASDQYLDSYRPNANFKGVEMKSAPTLASYGGPTWGVTEELKIKAPGETVPFKSLQDGHVAVEYLRGRGFNIQELRDLPPVMALHYCTHGSFTISQGLGTTTGRIVFPVFFNTPANAAGQHLPANPSGWQARQVERTLFEDDVVGEKEVWNGYGWRKFKKVGGEWEDKFVPKYYTMPGFPKSSVLYNFDVAKRYKKVAVVEGALDVLRVGEACVGTFGTYASAEQVRLLKAYWDEVILIRDPGVDPRNEKFKKLLDQLTGLRVTHLSLSGSRDPGSTERGSTWQQIAEAEEARFRNLVKPEPN